MTGACGSDPTSERDAAEFDIDDGAGAGESVYALATPDTESVLELKTGAKVVVPAGALTKEVELGLKRPSDAQAKELLKTLASTDKAVSAPYVLTPHGTTFEKEAEVTLPISKQSDTKKLAVVWLEDERDKQWKDLGKPSAVAGKKASIRLSHFSVLLLVERDATGSTPGDGDSGDGDGGPGPGSAGRALGEECASDGECGSGLICESFQAVTRYGIDEQPVCMPACTTSGEACMVGDREGQCGPVSRSTSESRLVCKVFNPLNAACGNRVLAVCGAVQLATSWYSVDCRALYEQGNEQDAVGFCVFGCEAPGTSGPLVEGGIECPLNHVRSSDPLWFGCCVLPTVVGQDCTPYFDFQNPSPSDRYVACSEGQTCEPNDPVSPTGLVCVE